MDRHGRRRDVRRQVDRPLQERLLLYIRRPQFGHGGCGAEQSGGDPDGSDLHEQRLVVGPQVMASCAIVGETALQAQMVAVPSMGKDHHGTAHARHVQQRPRPPQQRGVRATRLRR